MCGTCDDVPTARCVAKFGNSITEARMQNGICDKAVFFLKYIFGLNCFTKNVFNLRVNRNL